RRPRRPLPRGLLLGLVFHDARAHRERPHRSREEYARQLCSPDRNGGAHSERQPDVLSQPQPAAVLRRHGRVVRAGDGYRARGSVPRRARGGARVLDERGGASRAGGGPGVSPRRAAARGRALTQPLLGRSAPAQARGIPSGLRDRADASGSPARVVLSQRQGHRRERLGLLEPLDARPERPAHARDHRPNPGGLEQSPLSRRADDRRAAGVPRTGRGCGGRETVQQGLTTVLSGPAELFRDLRIPGPSAEQFSRAAEDRRQALLVAAYDPASGFFYDVRWRSGERVTDRPTLAAASPLYFGLATPEQGRAVAARLEREFLKPGGFVTTLIPSGQQWDAPNGW